MTSSSETLKSIHLLYYTNIQNVIQEPLVGEVLMTKTWGGAWSTYHLLVLVQQVKKLLEPLHMESLGVGLVTWA